MFLRQGRLRVKNRNFINAKCNELWRWRMLEMEEKVKKILTIQISKREKNEHDLKQHPRIPEYNQKNSQDKRKY